MPLFAWNEPDEAKAVWEGFLWSPRLYQPLLASFKSQFLATAHHYDELGEHRQQFAALLTYAALGPTQGYTEEDFRGAIGVLPQEGLEESAQALYQALEAPETSVRTIGHTEQSLFGKKSGQNRASSPPLE